MAGTTQIDGAKKLLNSRFSLTTTLFVLIILSSTIDMTDLNRTFHVITVVPLVFLFGVAAVLKSDSLRIPRYALVAYAVLWTIYSFQAVLPPLNSWALIRIPILMTTSFIILIVAPQTVDLDDFLYFLYLFPVVLTLIGLPTLIFGEVHLATLQIAPHEVPKQPPFLEVWIHPLKSVLSNPNPFGFVAGLGFVSGLSFYYRFRRRVDLFFLIILSAGVYLSASRGAFATTAIGVGLLSAYHYLDARAVYALTGAGLLGFGYLLAAGLGYLPDYVGTATLIPARIRLWTAATKAILANPILGTGFQPIGDAVAPYTPAGEITNNIHNTYLYVLMTRGIVGGLVHFGFLGLLYRNCLAGMRDIRGAALLSILTMVLVEMLFEGLAMFGLSLFSVIPALVFGFALFQTLDPEE